MAIWDNMNPMADSEDELFADFDAKAAEERRIAEEEKEKAKRDAFGTFGVKPQAAANPFFASYRSNYSNESAVGFKAEDSGDSSEESQESGLNHILISGDESVLGQTLDTEQKLGMSPMFGLQQKVAADTKPDLISDHGESQADASGIDTGSAQSASLGSIGMSTLFQGRANDPLLMKLKRYVEMFAECETLATMIKPENSIPQVDGIPAKKRSFIRYFWPFLVGAIGGGFFVYYVGVFLVVLSRLNTIAEQGTDVVIGDTLLSYGIAILVAVIIAIFGVKIAKAKQSKYNSEVEYQNTQEEVLHQKAVNNQKMISQYQQNIQKMNEYEQLLPPQYRNIDAITALVEIFESGKAATLDEACALLA